MLPQLALTLAKEAEKQARDAAAVPDAQLLKPPQIELLLDPAALEKDDEKVLARQFCYRDRVPDVRRKRRRLSYKNLVEAEKAAAAAAAAAEEAEEDEGSEEEEISEDAEQRQESGSEDEAMEDAAAAAPAADAGPAAAAPAAAPPATAGGGVDGSGEAAAAAVAPAAAPAPRPAATPTHLEPAAELLHCAYGRVAVLYASWTEPSQVYNYIWRIDELQTTAQVAARGKSQDMSQTAGPAQQCRELFNHMQPSQGTCYVCLLCMWLCM
jgi:hypothetical protein